ncbi:MAG TPA: transglycosylase SLT domain-containing protein [Noviherbaspirillum sp.]
MQRVRVAAHRTVLVAGVSAIGAIGVMFVKPELTDHIKAMSPFAASSTQQAAASPVSSPDVLVAAQVASMPATQAAAAPAQAPAQIIQATLPATPVAVAPATTTAAAAAPEHVNAVEHAASIPASEGKEVATKEQKWVTNWLAKRYRVAGDAANMLVGATYRTAREVKIDPLLVLAVMAIESGFNPFAESPVGAQGLMQVMSKVHHDKFQPLGGVKAALNPVANIKVGATILKEYVSRGGSVESGLKMYVGAAAFENDAGYGYKVLAEYKRLKEVASGKSVPWTTAATATVAAKTPPKPATPPADDKVDALTQAETPSLREKTQDQDGIVAAL